MSILPSSTLLERKRQNNDSSFSPRRPRHNVVNLLLNRMACRVKSIPWFGCFHPVLTSYNFLEEQQDSNDSIFDSIFVFSWNSIPFSLLSSMRIFPTIERLFIEDGVSRNLQMSLERSGRLFYWYFVSLRKCYVNSGRFFFVGRLGGI